MVNETKVDQKGYVLVYKPDHKYSKTKNGWIPLHRSVVEDFLGIRLEKGWCIHHINLCKIDNNLENLMLFKSHKEHTIFHNKLKRTGITNPMKRAIENRWRDLIGK